jgi:hypothetical protein
MSRILTNANVTDLELNVHKSENAPKQHDEQGEKTTKQHDHQI